MNIHRIRKKLKLTQSKLAQLTGYSSRMVAAFEAGERKPEEKFKRCILYLEYAFDHGYFERRLPD